MSTPTGEQAVTIAQSKIGDPYIWAAAGPDSFDCSGLIQYSYIQAGVKNVPRTSEEQYNWATPINVSQLQPGDLVFSQWPGDKQASPGHVQIYAGNGQVIEAAEPGTNVRQAPLSEDNGYIVGYGQPPGITTAAPGPTAQTTSFSLNPLSWLQGLFGGTNSGGDYLQRAGLIIFGGLLIVVGILMLAGKQALTIVGDSNATNSKGTKDKAQHGSRVRQEEG